MLKSHKIIPSTQFRFIENHSSTHQIIDKIVSSFKNQNFLAVSQVFNRVWHTSLLFKKVPPLYLFTKSYLQNRSFLVCQGDSLSTHSNSITAYQNLQIYLDNISKWSSKWRIQINSGKSFHIPLTLRKGILTAIYFQNNQIPTTTYTK